MNTRERLLQKQNEQLRQQVAFMGSLLDRAVAENEYLASVGCGFAWDLSARCVQWKLVHTARALEFGTREYDVDMGTVERMWDAAVKEASES